MQEGNHGAGRPVAHPQKLRYQVCQGKKLRLLKFDTHTLCSDKIFFQFVFFLKEYPKNRQIFSGGEMIKTYLKTIFGSEHHVPFYTKDILEIQTD